ncbi:hypothetical protein KUTeg_004958 [Tegillarca granosa]|uniref:Polycomb group RING finger protein 1 n=1 Tax=Tegillarca granosa TaxID=220873 RepID=A0ABQ9FIG4_TEGGR|nr:hypothetical protein KUTeg_004958 [Tegillarca granosa]
MLNVVDSNLNQDYDCKSCIVKYLQSSKNCPQCSNKIHETQPLFNLRADRTMQDIVYKLVPHLFESEEKRREEFYKSKGFKKQKKGVVEEKSGPKLSCILNNPNAHQYQYDDQICLCVDRYSPQLMSTDNGVYTLPVLDKKFIRCSVRVLIAHLKRMIKNKLSIPNTAKGTPMLLFYRMSHPAG